MRKIYIVGAGGLASVMVATIEACGHQVGGILDDNRDQHGKLIMGTEIIGGLDLLKNGLDGQVIMAIGSNQTRKKITETYASTDWAIVVHPAAYIFPKTTIGSGTFVSAGAVISAEVSIGRHSIVNMTSVVGHHSNIGEFVHIGPGVQLTGNTQIGEGVFLGTSSSVLPGVSVGAWTTVGAGALVARDLPAGITAVGMPAKPIKERSREEGQA